MHGWIERKHFLSCEWGRERERKKSSIKCQIKTEGGRLQRAEQPAVEGAPCEPLRTLG